MKLLTAAAATGAGSTFNVGGSYRGTYRTLRVQIATGTATVVLQGRMDSNDGWSNIVSVTASGMQGVLLPPQVRVNVSALSGATVDVWVDAQAA